ncbi:MAG: phospholipid carrier-dependent glycosyltransferase, partial [Deltaproteobacteria bacterium]
MKEPIGASPEAARIHRLLLLLVLSLALVTRFYDLSGNPNGFFCDEASYAYNGYAIMETGRDEYGVPFPFYFRAFGEYKDPFPVYVTIPFLRVFGLTVFATRFPVALFGVLSVLFGYLCVRELAGRRVALIAALFLALSPYHIHFSRIGFPTPYLHFFFLSGFYLLLRGIRGKGGALVASAVPLGLTLYTYGVAKVFLPLFLLAFAVVFRRELLERRRSCLLMGVLLVLIGLPVVHQAVFGVGQDSFRWKSVFAPHTLTRQEFVRRLAGIPLLSGAVGHPDLVSWLFFLDNYLWLLRPSTLFFEGDP